MAGKPHILMMADEMAVGGVQHHLLGLAEGLQRDGFPVTVVTVPGGYLQKQLKERGIPIESARLRRPFSLGGVRDAVRVLQRHKPAILHTHGGTAGFYGRLAARLIPGIRTVHTYHGIHYLHSGDPIRRWILRVLDRFLAAGTGRTICVASSDYGLVLRAKLARAGRASIIRYGIDLNRFDGRRKQAVDSAAADRHAALIGTVGRLHPQKGQRYFLESAAAVLRAMPSARFRVVGDGELRGELENLASELGISRNVEFTGASADVPSHLNDMDIFVLPSLWEGLPIALLEALAAGIPVIATRVDGICDVIDEGKNGVLVPPRDPAALADAILALLQNSSRRRQLAAAGRATVESGYDIRSMIQSIERVYLDVWSD